MAKHRTPFPLEKSTDPHQPLPPQPDQGAPELGRATGRVTGGPSTGRSQSGAYLTSAQGARLADTDHSLKAEFHSAAGSSPAREDRALRP